MYEIFISYIVSFITFTEKQFWTDLKKCIHELLTLLYKYFCLKKLLSAFR